MRFIYVLGILWATTSVSHAQSVDYSKLPDSTIIIPGVFGFGCGGEVTARVPSIGNFEPEGI
jgi:hypothetical protein